MSTRLSVLTAVRAMIEQALPDAEVAGLDDDNAPARIPLGGRIVVRSGDPGDAEIDLSPLVYNWAHKIPVEMIFAPTDDATAEASLDAALDAIGAAILADRHLGGLCEWLDAVAPTTDDLFIDGAEAPRAADLLIIANYSTSSPTG